MQETGAATEGMDERELRQIILAHIETAEGGEGSRLSAERRRNLDYYDGEAYGDERDGHSQIVTREVMDTVEWILPMLMRVFHGTDQVARFEPVGAEDQKVADLRTDYVNHIYLKDNPGYEISTDVLKSGLIEKNGYWQVSWSEERTSSRAEYSGLTEDAVGVLSAEEGSGEVAITRRRAGPAGAGPEPRYDVTVRRFLSRTRCKVESVPPEEMVVTARAKSLDHAIESGGLVGRRYTLTRGQLAALGYDREAVRNLPSTGGLETRSERQNRYRGQRATAAHRQHWSQEEVALADVWLKIDFDGDGFAELRMCRLAGETANAVLLENEETDDHPFVDWTPIRKHFSQEGIAVADAICELQLLKSTLWRQLLDSLYSSVNPEYEVVKDQVADWDSVLIDEPGNMKFVHAPGTVRALEKPFVGAAAAPILDRVDQVIEGRSGVSSVTAGINPDLLRPHAEGTVERILSAARERVGLIARNFAELGLKNVMLKIAKVTAANQDGPRELRLRNELVEVDPRAWTAELDVTVDVGLGTGDERAKIAQLTYIATKQEQILRDLGPINPLVSMKQYYNTLALLAAKADLPSPDPFFIDPTSRTGKRNAATMQAMHERAERAREAERQQVLGLEASRTAQRQREAQQKAVLAFLRFAAEQDFDRDKLAAELAVKAQELEARYGAAFDPSLLEALNRLVQSQGAATMTPGATPGAAPGAAPGQGAAT